MRVLITGIAGAVGSYLAEYISKQHPDVQLFGIVRSKDTDMSNLAEVGKLTLIFCDMAESISPSTLGYAEPDIIFHLASWARVRQSFDTPIEYLHNNIQATSRLFEAVRLAKIDPVIVLASTSEVYGSVRPDEVPIRETNPLRPANPYAVSKVSQDLLGAVYFKAYGMRIVTTRTFGYINPRRDDLAASNFARQIALCEIGKQEVVYHGNLDSVRTFLDVRDVVRAYWTAAEKCVPGAIYNVGSPVPVRIGGLLSILLDISGHDFPTRHDPALMRPTDISAQIPDISKFTGQTQWSAKVPLHESLTYLLDTWRIKVAQ